MIRKLLRAVAVTTVVVLGTGPASVLHAQHGGMMGMAGPCPMMGDMVVSPGMLLERGEALELTADQVRRLEALEARAREQRTAMMERMNVLRQRIQTAIEGEDFDERAVRAALEGMPDAHMDSRVAMLRMRHDVWQVLTPEQRAQVEEHRSRMGRMHRMHGMMGGGTGEAMLPHGMMVCPMMGHPTMHGRMRDGGAGSGHPPGEAGGPGGRDR